VTKITKLKTPVAIIGAGPVGLTLALFLHRYGIRSVLFNTEDGTRSSPKGSTFNARTMEHYRRIGLSERIRAAGLPPEHPTDVAYFTRFNGWELARIRMPSERAKMRAVAEAGLTDQCPEPLLRANQMYVEPILLEEARHRPNITMRFGWEAIKLEADDDVCTVVAESRGVGGQETWQARYVVGCDGARSFVRRQLGARYGGFEALDQIYMGGRMTASHVQAPTLVRDWPQASLAWQYWSINPEHQVMLTALNGKDEFLLFSKAPEANAETDRAVADIIRRAAGADIPLRMLSHRPWTAGVALVAERFGCGNVFLAGDAAHLFTPTGGFGLNTGVDDVANLSWKIAAMLQGWGGPALMSSYELERKPIAVRNTVAARELAKRMSQIPIGPALEDDSAEGAQARIEAGEYLSTFVETFASIGVQLGARYDHSPIVAGEGVAIADDFSRYEPTSAPGGRTPHAWLDERHHRGGSLFDQLGPGFTLLYLGVSAAATNGLQSEAERRGIPFNTLVVPDPNLRDLYERDFVLVRPDQHVAWRGNRLPEHPIQLLNLISGDPAGVAERG
jgi:2-polyprenyl-6-methoxyphenol hydroxylase-like FAD-dependent oxidoreductase